MSSDYYFIKWRETLIRLEELIHLDQEFQRTKVHDKKRCDAVIRLCGILGEYIVLYNDAMECWQENLQVQKTAYMADIVRAITNRILELKHDIRKLEYSDTQFLGHGLAHHKLTPFNAELDEVPTHEKRPAHIEAMITDAFKKAEEKKLLLKMAEENEKETAEAVENHNWWDEERSDTDESLVKSKEEEPETEEMIQTRQMASLIQAQERARQVIQWMTLTKQKREMWEKELAGTLKPHPHLELKERGAKIIQKAIRAFFEIKRKKRIECKEDEILGIRLCGKFNKEEIYAANELKYEQQEAKMEEKMKKTEALMKKKLEEKLAQKLMKNPNMHPGFHYPESKRTDHILELINNYKKDWDDWDHTESLEVKKKFVPDIDITEVYAEVKMELMQTVDDDMRNELKTLKKALKKDYITNEEPFPEPMKKTRKRAKRKQKVRGKKSENLAEKLEVLACNEILKQYPRVTLKDFLGDHNFAGDDMRCNYEPALHFSGETRALWWERCREATHGFHKILVVGPRLSGKTILVHALATVTDAVLFELDVSYIQTKSSSSAEMQQFVNSVVVCAKAVQPSVIHIKHINRLYYKKVPPEEANINFNVMTRSVSKMLKKINQLDKIAVIGKKYSKFYVGNVDEWRSYDATKLWGRILEIGNTAARVK